MLCPFWHGTAAFATSAAAAALVVVGRDGGRGRAFRLARNKISHAQIRVPVNEILNVDHVREPRRGFLENTRL